MSPQALIFDWDGTVVDLKRDWKELMIRAVWDSIPLSNDPACLTTDFVALRTAHMSVYLRETEGKHTNEQIEYIVQEMMNCIPDRLWHEHVPRQAINLYNARMRDDAIKTIASTRRDLIVNQAIEATLMSATCPCYVVSGSTLIDIRDFANRLDLLKHFRQILAYDQRLHPIFSKAQACKSILDQLSCSNEQVWGFGDTKSDIDLYLGLGMRAFMVEGDQIVEMQA